MCETRTYRETEFIEQSACLQFLEGYWGKERCISKYLEHKRMENNNNRDPLVAPQIGWGEESVGLLLLRASKADDVVAAVSFTGGSFIWILEGDYKLSRKYPHGSFSTVLQSLCLI